MSSEKSFSMVFFKIYDKYITHGEDSFSELKIPKIAFTNICMNADYVFDDEIIIRICEKLSLQGQERDDMISFLKND